MGFGRGLGGVVEDEEESAGDVRAGEVEKVGFLAEEQLAVGVVAVEGRGGGEEEDVGG